MSRNKESRKSSAPPLTSEETREIEMIRDRLAIQDPRGQSLDGYLRSLRGALEGRERVAAALMEVLAKSPNEVAFRAFSALRGLALSGEAKRAAKQVAYRFAARGFTQQPGAPAASAAPVVLIQKEVRPPLAHVIHAPGAFAFLAAFLPGPAMIVTALCPADLSRLEARTSESTQKAYREFVGGTAREFSSQAVEVPVSHAARLFFEMIDLAEAASPETEDARRLLSPHHDPDAPEYPATLLPVVEHPAERLAEINVPGLLTRIELTPLLPSREALLPYYERLKDLESPLLVIPREVQEQRAAGLLAEAAERLFIGPRRVLARRYLAEQALRFHLTREPATASWAWIAAEHLRSGAGAGENPVLVKAVGAALMRHFPEHFAKAAQPAPEEPREAFTRTGSGLILPR